MFAMTNKPQPRHLCLSWLAPLALALFACACSGDGTISGSDGGDQADSGIQADGDDTAQDDGGDAIEDGGDVLDGGAPAPGTFELENLDLSVGESDGTLDIAINRVGGSDGEASVQWSTQAGTADGPGDFQRVDWTSLTFADGETRQVVPVAITPDEVPEGPETFSVLLANPSGATLNPARAVATVSIVDDDAPQSAKAFPGAEGFGKDASGGRGGVVRKVTQLGDSGPGSFREAVETPGAAYVVFEVAGTINLQSNVSITSDKTIAGETAFRNGGEGITLKINQGTTKNTLVTVPSGSSNIICRYLRFRRGPGLAPEVDGDNLLLLGSGTDFIFDHCSFSWSTDEVINPYGPSEITFQNCIFSEALFNSTHAYSSDPDHANYPSPHSMGPLIGNGTSRLTFYNCLFAHNNQRNPLVGGSVGGGSEFELVNNVVYNYGYFGTQLGYDGTPVFVNLINNYHIAGPDTATVRYAITIIDGVSAYAQGNINNKRNAANEPEWDAIGCSSGCGDYMTEPAPSAWQSVAAFDFPLKDLATMPALAVRDGVLGNSGAALFQDAVDTRLFNDVLNGTGGFIDDPDEVGGWPYLADMSSVPADSDNDGMADAWEAQTFGSLATDTNDDADGDGYTNLEEYLHFLAAGGS